MFLALAAVQLFSLSAEAQQPELSVRLRIVQILDSQGKVGFPNPKGPLNFHDASQLVRDANELYKPAGISLLFSARDFETRSDDYLNLDSDPPASNAILADRQRRPTVTGDRERLKAFQAIADERKDALTVFIHRGSEWYWNSKSGQWQFGTGYAHGVTEL